MLFARKHVTPERRVFLPLARRKTLMRFHSTLSMQAKLSSHAFHPVIAALPGAHDSALSQAARHHLDRILSDGSLSENPDRGKADA